MGEQIAIAYFSIMLIVWVVGANKWKNSRVKHIEEYNAVNRYGKEVDNVEIFISWTGVSFVWLPAAIVWGLWTIMFTDPKPKDALKKAKKGGGFYGRDTR